MVRDTWHIVSGSKGVTCYVQNESNMSSNRTHERHVATCEWVKIHGRWIRDKGNLKVANKDWPCGNERTSPLDPILTKLVGKRKRKERRNSRERGSTFSLDFLAIGLSNSDETKGKVDLHCKSYAWVPILWSFDKLREVGVFILLELIFG